MRSTLPARSAAVALFASSAFAASAQPIPPDESTIRPELSPTKFELRLRGEHNFDSDIDEGGSVVINRLGAGLSVDGQVSERLFLGVGVDEELSFYDFSSETIISGSSEPLKEANETSILGRFRFELAEKWWLNGGGGVRSSVETGAGFGEGLTFGGYLAPTYQFNPNFRLGLGAIVASRLEDDTIVVPIIIIEWKINDRLTLSNGPGTLRGPGLQLAYAYSDFLLFTFDASYEMREFRLDTDNVIEEGVARDSRFPVAVGARWQPMDGFELGVRGGASFASELEFLDDAGDTVFKSDLDAAPFVAFDIIIRM